MPEPDKDAIIEALRNENEYLKKLLSAHGIPYRQRKFLSQHQFRRKARLPSTVPISEETILLTLTNTFAKTERKDALQPVSNEKAEGAALISENMDAPAVPNGNWLR